ncbi:Uncharacterized protein APZ42_030877 [Daphnia magna]|uniref:Uncharacterized protein n=1 Tax=Daphnia magna TaxID=35525 RepID=A0A164NDQ0_9CRUS|nr:Uncharacterized protein APZ42_030877 [Daphnia magna]
MTIATWTCRPFFFFFFFFLKIVFFYWVGKFPFAMETVVAIGISTKQLRHLFLSFAFHPTPHNE